METESSVDKVCVVGWRVIKSTEKWQVTWKAGWGLSGERKGTAGGSGGAGCIRAKGNGTQVSACHNETLYLCVLMLNFNFKNLLVRMLS